MELRRNMTLAEILLWRCLKQRQMLGYDFDRQKPVGEFIVDFFCRELCLAIEVDGCSHNNKKTDDKQRQACLEALGVRVIRFWYAEVKTDI